MNANGSSSSPWPTPDAQLFNDREEPATWLARQAVQKEKQNNGNGMGMSIAMAAKTWPTPNATDGDKAPEHFSRGPSNPSLPSAAKTWSTPRSSDGEKGGPNQTFSGGGVPLVTQTAQWSTPSVADVTGGRTSRSGDRKGELLLNSQAKAVGQWMTPRVEAGGYTRDKGNPDAERLTLEGQAKAKTTTLASSLPAPEISKPGETPSPERRILNPRFVEWLMGWPPGWTLLASTSSASWETELSGFRRRMRFALSQLTSPAAPPAQMSLFG